MITNLLINQLERFFNQAIQADEDALLHLRLLVGKTLALSIDLPNTTLNYIVEFHSQYIKIGEAKEPSADIIVFGSPAAFLCLLITKDPLFAKQQGLKFTDQTEIVQHVQALFLQLDIDWEEHLSLFTGDIVAHELGKLARKTRAEVKTSAADFAEMLSEFLTEEQRLSPTTAEIELFLQDVAELRSHVARLEARYNLLNLELVI